MIQIQIRNIVEELFVCNSTKIIINNIVIIIPKRSIIVIVPIISIPIKRVLFPTDVYEAYRSFNQLQNI